MTNERLQAHALLDMLPDGKINVVRNLLEVMVAPASSEPLSVSLAMVPFEDEEITPETASAIERARASLASGDGIQHDEILREFGLS